VYDYANAKYTGATLAFGNVHVGATVSAQNVAIGNQTVTNASYQDLLNVSATTGNAKVTATGFTGLAASTNGATTSNLSFGVNTTTAGSLASTATLSLVSNANGVSGLSNGTATVEGSPAAITTTGEVYSGLSTWNTNGSSSWGTLASGFGANWGANQGSPGLDATFNKDDTATFGNVLTSGTATVSLDGASPSLKAITFNNTNGASYLITQGSSGSLTLNNGGSNATVTNDNGNHEISAGVTLSSNTTAAVTNSGNTLTLSGPIAGSGNLTKDGAGTLALTNTNTYTGATNVNDGTLLINGSTHASSAVGVANGAALGGDGTVGGNATFNNGSIFAWNLSVTDPSSKDSITAADTFAVTGNLVDGDAVGGSVFKVLLAGNQSFADTFWTTSHTWSNVLTSGNSLALESLFTGFSYANANGSTSAPTAGSFSLSGSALNFTAVPEPTSALAGLLLGAGLLRRKRRDVKF